MELKSISDDFFSIGKISILHRNTGNASYDFNFRNFFDCKSVIAETGNPVLLHVGAVDDYAGVEAACRDLGMSLLVREHEHLKCSRIENWYPIIKDKTPFTKVYDVFPSIDEVLESFSFPVFIKGSRQTNRHKKSQCIIENAEQFATLKRAWESDDVLYWQKVAIRDYTPLETIDSETFPDMVPMSNEFRFFYFEGKCMAYGPYWSLSKQYSLPPSELTKVMELTDWAAGKLNVAFPAIDVAKTAEGDWIIIEINDAQESGFVGANPLELWNNTISAAQDRSWHYVDEIFDEDTVILASEPLAEITVTEAWDIAKSLSSTHELAKIYAGVHNKFWWVEDNEYDYEEGTEEYKNACEVTDAWGDLMDYLKDRVVATAEQEGLLLERQKNSGLIKQIEPFMKKYGFKNGNGWWVKLGKTGEENEYR